MPVPGHNPPVSWNADFVAAAAANPFIWQDHGIINMFYRALWERFIRVRNFGSIGRPPSYPKSKDEIQGFWSGLQRGIDPGGTTTDRTPILILP